MNPSPDHPSRRLAPAVTEARRRPARWLGVGPLAGLSPDLQV